MIFLSPLLLAITSTIFTLQVSSNFKNKKIQLPKFIILLIAIIVTIGTFISMLLGKFILTFFDPSLGNIFGAVVLSLSGVYFISDNFRIQKKHAGYDTSFYFENGLQYKSILENPSIVDLDKSNSIELKECLTLSTALILNILYTTFGAGLTGINISISIFFYFIFSVIFLYLGSLYFNTDVYNWLKKNGSIISGLIIIILGIYEAFI